jgi:hypothetical protein
MLDCCSVSYFISSLAHVKFSRATNPPTCRSNWPRSSSSSTLRPPRHWGPHFPHHAARAAPTRWSSSRLRYVSFWHEADIKLRPLFGRYKVESGRHRLVMSISAFDPSRHRRALIAKKGPPSQFAVAIMTSRYVHDQQACCVLQSQ